MMKEEAKKYLGEAVYDYEELEEIAVAEKAIELAEKFHATVKTMLEKNEMI